LSSDIPQLVEASRSDHERSPAALRTPPEFREELILRTAGWSDGPDDDGGFMLCDQPLHVDFPLEPLKRDARIAYERGRFVAATQVALIIVPITALCAFETRSFLRAGVLGLALLVLTVGLRWRQRSGSAGLLHPVRRTSHWHSAPARDSWPVPLLDGR
jgi:hypothetical protein